MFFELDSQNSISNVIWIFKRNRTLHYKIVYCLCSYLNFLYLFCIDLMKKKKCKKKINK